MPAQRLYIQLTGLLQGIGFRPFVYRLAQAQGLAGWVANVGDAVALEVEGESEALQVFISQLRTEMPGCGQIDQYQQAYRPVTGQAGFYFAASRSSAQANTFICADIATCADCVRELFEPNNRRYQHPFISCCHCGPRYSIVSALPYDRCRTSMAQFSLCAACRVEYHNPQDRRFFAQTIACPHCGPQMQFCNPQGEILYTHQAAWQAAVDALQAGQIIAVKGIGGFQLLVDAGNVAAVARLRQRKQRGVKPFALMVASLAQAETLCYLTALERRSLTATQAPIVLSRAKPGILAQTAAPAQKFLGLMLPHAPIHHLLLAALQTPVIATSGNQQDEPICIDNTQALARLAGIADGFLWHDRAILRPLDDSIVRIIADIPTVLRRARGFVPLPIALARDVPASLAVGAQQKNTVALALDKQLILSQHLGDLNTQAALQQHAATCAELKQLYGIKPEQVVCDWHPDYGSSRYAQQLHLPVQRVQHHQAHILAVMAEHGLQPPLLGIAWDGTGLGEHQALWGGEFLYLENNGFKRVAHCRPFPLIGGIKAIKEPRRAALGLLYAALGEQVFTPPYASLLSAFSANELKLLHAVLTKQLNCPLTSSMGRVFDAFASLLHICHYNQFEGQAAMALEQAALNCDAQQYPIKVIDSQPLVLDWQPLLTSVLSALNYVPMTQIAANIHQTLADGLFQVAKQLGVSRLVLSGGCFQNGYLVECILRHPLAKDYQLFRHSQIPPNDGGIAVGQIYALAMR